MWDVTHLCRGWQVNQFRISTHTSRVGCDHIRRCYVSRLVEFLLTHPVWDVTLIWGRSYSQTTKFLLTHPVWDVTDSLQRYQLMCISTHTSRVGCDFSYCKVPFPTIFLLTHPVWDVTTSLFCVVCLSTISTHTSRVGCDIQLAYYIHL